MKIIKTAEGLALKVNENELVNIYTALLQNLANFKNMDMPITKEMAKTIDEYYQKPF